ncbi:hypothetical protein JI435_037070, partial [Parastagonospora nodorum SN15]
PTPSSQLRISRLLISTIRNGRLRHVPRRPQRIRCPPADEAREELGSARAWCHCRPRHCLLGLHPRHRHVHQQEETGTPSRRRLRYPPKEAR